MDKNNVGIGILCFQFFKNTYSKSLFLFLNKNYIFSVLESFFLKKKKKKKKKKNEILVIGNFVNKF